jgi:hypothetical protein
MLAVPVHCRAHKGQALLPSMSFRPPTSPASNPIRSVGIYIRPLTDSGEYKSIALADLKEVPVEES